MKYAEYGLMQNETIIFLHGGGLAPWNYCDKAEQLQDRFHIIIPVLDDIMGATRILRQLRIMPMRLLIILMRISAEGFL